MSEDKLLVRALFDKIKQLNNELGHFRVALEAEKEAREAAEKRLEEVIGKTSCA